MFIRSVILAVALGVAGSASAQNEKIFEFRGVNTEVKADFSGVTPKGCYREGLEIDCTDYNDPVIAGKKLEYLSTKFNDGKLYLVYGSFMPHAYTDILSAFVAKYGDPDSVETRKWQSKAGAVFDNEVVIWKFKGGNLELNRMGSRVDRGSFDFYSDENAPLPDKPKVDF